MRVMKKRAFSLVELMLVVVILGIIGALILLNMSTSEKIDAQGEANRYVRSLHSVRAAWIAYNADKHVFLGVPSYDVTQAAVIQRSLEIYASRPDLASDVNRYGGIIIETVPATATYSRIYLGFDGSGNFGGSGNKGDILRILNGAFGVSYNLTSKDSTKSFGDNNLMLRVW
ncbi:MAG: type II secretion system GspH family protein [Synergistaceae bacterium]|nr:type II secretion system GspH family protein [Synergistaceae bacterium]